MNLNRFSADLIAWLQLINNSDNLEAENPSVKASFVFLEPNDIIVQKVHGMDTSISCSNSYLCSINQISNDFFVKVGR